MVRSDMAGIDKVFEDNLKGLPLGAVDWSSGVLKSRVNEFMKSNLPEFRADFDVSADEMAKVDLTVYPLLPVVRTMELSMRSDTVPNFTLLYMRQLLQDEANQLVGMPVAFVDRHKAELEKYFADTLDSTNEFRYFSMNTKVSLGVGEAMYLMSRSNAAKFRLRGELSGDFGNTDMDADHSVRARLRIGWMPTEKDDFYLMGDVYPKAQEWFVRTRLGYMRNVFGKLWLGAQYDFRNSGWESEVKYNFDKKWSIRHEYMFVDRRYELALRYNLHDYLGLELINGKRNNWIRIIGSF